MVGKKALVPPKAPVPVKNGELKVTVLAEVPEAIELFTVSILRLYLLHNQVQKH